MAKLEESLDHKMKALRFSSLGSLESLKLEDMPTPVAQTGEVLVEIKAAGLNPSDLRNVLGSFPYTTLPRTPGRDFAGVVVSGPQNMIGLEVWGTGNELGFTRDGSHAEYLSVDAAGVSPKPKSLSFGEAASCGVPYVTAWLAMERTSVVAGTNILVIGAAGSVGSAAVRLARLRGANVVGAVRREEQAKQLVSIDVQPILLNDGGGLSELAHNFFRDGPDVIFDTTGFWLSPSVGALAKYGRVAVIAAPKDGMVDVPVRMLYRRGGSIVGVDSMLHDSRSCAAMLTRIGRFFDDSLLPPPSGFEARPLIDALKAYRDLERGSSAKVVFV